MITDPFKMLIEDWVSSDLKTNFDDILLLSMAYGSSNPTVKQALSNLLLVSKIAMSDDLANIKKDGNLPPRTIDWLIKTASSSSEPGVLSALANLLEITIMSNMR